MTRYPIPHTRHLIRRVFDRLDDALAEARLRAADAEWIEEFHRHAERGADRAPSITDARARGDRPGRGLGRDVAAT